jgi:hypothetical protein
MSTGITPLTRWTVFNDGLVAPSAKLYTYASGTSTPLATYTDAARTTPHANPIVADAEGVLPVFYLSPVAYRFLVTTSLGVTIHAAQDNIFDFRVAMITAKIDGAGATITTGEKDDLYIPVDCTIIESVLLADQSGSIVLDVWKDLYANYPPTVADTITASAKPTITGATKSQDTTLTGWTTTIVAGSTLRWTVDSASAIQRVRHHLIVRIP